MAQECIWACIMAFPGFGFGFGMCSGFGVCTPSSVPGRGSRFVRVGVGCGCFSPYLVLVCGACVCVRVAGSVVGMLMGMLLLSHISWIGLAVSVLLRVWNVISHFLAEFAGGLCGHWSPPYPSFPELVVRRMVRFQFPLMPACRGASGSASWCFPGWTVQLSCVERVVTLWSWRRAPSGVVSPGQPWLLLVPAPLGGGCHLWSGVVGGLLWGLSPPSIPRSCGCRFPVLPVATHRWLQAGGFSRYGFRFFCVVVHSWPLLPIFVVVPLGTAPPPPFFCGSVSLPAVLVVSASLWLVDCLFPGGGLSRLSELVFLLARRQPCGRCGPPSLAAAWLWAGRVGVLGSYLWVLCVSPLVSPGWGIARLTRLVAWLRCFVAAPMTGGIALVGSTGLLIWLLPAVSCSYIGRVSPPPCCCFFGGRVCFFLPPPSLGGCIH